MAKKNKRKGIMYSTNPDYDYEYEDSEQETNLNDMQLLHVHIDKHRAGKTAVIIKGFIGTKNDLISLSKILCSLLPVKYAKALPHESFSITLKSTCT